MTSSCWGREWGRGYVLSIVLPWAQHRPHSPNFPSRRHWRTDSRRPGIRPRYQLMMREGPVQLSTRKDSTAHPKSMAAYAKIHNRINIFIKFRGLSYSNYRRREGRVNGILGLEISRIWYYTERERMKEIEGKRPVADSTGSRQGVRSLSNTYCCLFGKKKIINDPILWRVWEISSTDVPPAADRPGKAVLSQLPSPGLGHRETQQSGPLRT